jgi:hypothetical protein
LLRGRFRLTLQRMGEGEYVGKSRSGRGSLLRKPWLLGWSNCYAGKVFLCGEAEPRNYGNFVDMAVWRTEGNGWWRPKRVTLVEEERRRDAVG